MIVAYINSMPNSAEDLERREERLREFEKLLDRQRPDKGWQQFLERQKQAKIEWVKPGEIV